MLTFLLGKKAIHPQQAVRQAPSFPLGKEAVLPTQLLTFPQAKEAILPWQLLTFLPGKEAILPQQLLTFPWVKEAVLPRQVNQAIKLGQSGKVLGNPTGIGHPRASQENSTISWEDKLTTTPQ